MSLKDNPLSDQQDGETAYGTVTQLREEDHINNNIVRVILFLLNSLYGGIKMVGVVFVMIGGLALLLGAFLGMPMFSLQLFDTGHYVWGVVFALISLIIYGIGFNKTR